MKSPTRKSTPLTNSILRPTTPKSPAAGSTFESRESSEGEEALSDNEEHEYEDVVNGNGHGIDATVPRKVLTYM